MGRQVTEQTVDTEANQAKISTIMCHRCGKMGHTRKNCKGKVYCEKCKTATHATVACKKTEGYQPKTPAQQGTNQQGYQPRVTQPLGMNQRAYQPKQTWQEKSQKCFRAIEENNIKHEQLVELSKYCTTELDKESERTAPTERDIEAELDRLYAQVDEAEAELDKTWQTKSQKCFRAIEENNIKREQLVELSKYCTTELDKESERTAPHREGHRGRTGKTICPSR